MSDEPRQILECVEKATTVAVQVLNLGNGVQVIPAEFAARFMQATRLQELRVAVLLRLVRELGATDERLNELWIDECQKMSDAIDEATKTEKSKIVLAGVAPKVNGHNGRFGKMKFPGV